MSSDDLEKGAWSPRAPSERLLMTLKMHGAQTSADVGRRQGITGEAARQQLGKLQEDGLVREERRSAGRGRPAVYWHLTDKAQARFPDTHAALTVDILRSISEVLGPEALDRIIAEREGVTLEKYRTAMSGCSDTRDRLEKLAEMRSAEGYMAQVEVDDDGTLVTTGLAQFDRNHYAIFNDGAAAILENHPKHFGRAAVRVRPFLRQTCATDCPCLRSFAAHPDLTMAEKRVPGMSPRRKRAAEDAEGATAAEESGPPCARCFQQGHPRRLCPFFPYERCVSEEAWEAFARSVSGSFGTTNQAHSTSWQTAMQCFVI